MHSSITTRTPWPRACGSTAARVAQTKLKSPSFPTTPWARCEQTTTIGFSVRTVRFRK
jgi:hypothetical protein